jgi:nicotinamidase-related amidase
MPSALLVVDVLNDFQHEDGDRLAASFRAAVEPLARLIADARRSGTPVIFAYDPVGRWSDSREAVVERARRGPVGDVIDAIAPAADEIVIVKPRYSAFDHTPLEIVLGQLGIDQLVLAGSATEMCVAQTAIDARELGLGVIVAADACAPVDPGNAEIALHYLENVAGVHLTREALVDAVS